MKRIRTFPELSPALQREAVAKVARLAELRAGYCGEIWTESSRALAEASRLVLCSGGRAIWEVRFAREPLVMPGTEFRRAA